MSYMEKFLSHRQIGYKAMFIKYLQSARYDILKITLISKNRCLYFMEFAFGMR